MTFEGRFLFQSSDAFPPPRKRIITVFQYPRDYSMQDSLDLGVTPIVDESKSCSTQKGGSLRAPILPPPAKTKPGHCKKPAILPKPKHLEKSNIDEKQQNEKCSQFLSQNETKEPLQNVNENKNAQDWKENSVNSRDLSQNSIQCHDEEHVYSDCCCSKNNNCSEAHHLDVLRNMEVKHSYLYGENDIESDKIQNHLNIIVTECRERRQRARPFHSKNEDSSKNEVDISNKRNNLQVINIRPRAFSASPPRRTPGKRKVVPTYSFRMTPKNEVTMYRKKKCTCQRRNSTFDPNTTHSCRCRSPLPVYSNSCPTSPWMTRTDDQHSHDHVVRREFISPPSPTPSSKSSRRRMFSGKDIMRKIFTSMKEKKNTVGPEQYENLGARPQSGFQNCSEFEEH